MARLMSQIRGGYYAAAPEAVAAVLERLRPPDYGDCLILDPCAGEAKGSMRFPTESSCPRIGQPWSGNLCPRVNPWHRPIFSAVGSATGHSP
jgi:hypothetical protein